MIARWKGVNGGGKQASPMYGYLYGELGVAGDDVDWSSHKIGNSVALRIVDEEIPDGYETWGDYENREPSTPSWRCPGMVWDGGPWGVRAIPEKMMRYLWTAKSWECAMSLHGRNFNDIVARPSGGHLPLGSSASWIPSDDEVNDDGEVAIFRQWNKSFASGVLMLGVWNEVSYWVKSNKWSIPGPLQVAGYVYMRQPSYPWQDEPHLMSKFLYHLLYGGIDATILTLDGIEFPGVIQDVGPSPSWDDAGKEASPPEINVTTQSWASL